MGWSQSKANSRNRVSINSYSNQTAYFGIQPNLKTKKWKNWSRRFSFSSSKFQIKIDTISSSQPAKKPRQKSPSTNSTKIQIKSLILHRPTNFKIHFKLTKTAKLKKIWKHKRPFWNCNYPPKIWRSASWRPAVFAVWEC